MIHLPDDPAAAVAEAFPVLAPGGRFAMTAGGKKPTGSAARLRRHRPAGGRAADLLGAAGFLGCGRRSRAWRSRSRTTFIEDLPERRREEFRRRLLTGGVCSGHKPV